MIPANNFKHLQTLLCENNSPNSDSENKRPLYRIAVDLDFTREQLKQNRVRLIYMHQKPVHETM